VFSLLGGKKWKKTGRSSEDIGGSRSPTFGQLFCFLGYESTSPYYTYPQRHQQFASFLSNHNLIFSRDLYQLSAELLHSFSRFSEKRCRPSKAINKQTTIPSPKWLNLNTDMANHSSHMAAKT